MVADGGRGKDNTESEEENPFIEYFAEVESVGAVERKEGDESRCRERHRVRIISMRVRICDPDNLVGGQKHLIDALRIAGVIPEDDPYSITLQVSQKKVSSYKDEETWVEVSK
jgi:hypothetical protein